MDQAAPPHQFYGTSENAVAAVTGRDPQEALGLGPSLHQILQVLSVTLFEKTPIVRAFHDIDSKDPHPSISNQLILFDL